ncbi:MAG: AAA family ATPase [Bacteroidales bacterium]|nr:AAA family ATPase [Bacteroidales bacterium]
MLSREGFLSDAFLRWFPYEPTPCQYALLGKVASFLTSDDGDILVVNGYAGTGKTAALASVINAMAELEVKCVLLAPTGRSAKVLSSYAGRPAYTIHKHIYRQKSFGSDGFGQFSLMPNKARNTLFIVDEVSLIGIEAGEKGSAFGSGNLLEDLVAFVRSGVDCRLILVGDNAQLPPVGLDASPALSPEYMAQFGGVSFATLTTVVRQGEGSGILVNATLLREKLSVADENPLGLEELGLVTKGFPDIESISGAELLDALADSYGKYGEDEVTVLCRSNKRAVRYNAGIRAQVLYREEQLVRGDKLMVVKNHYLEGLEGTDYIANGDIVRLIRIRHFEERYGLHFADATLALPDYGNQEITSKVLLDTLSSESASLTYEQSNALYQGVLADYSHITTKKKRYEAVREDPFYNAIQLKYASAITCHKAQGGQWQCVFVDNPVWQDFLSADDIKWLYTAFTRAVDKLYLVNFPKELFK